MANVRPFVCVRPAAALADKVAALPYDVYTREEARRAVAGNPLSFLNIDRADTQFPDDVDAYDPRVYARAKELLEKEIADGIFVTDPDESYYVYRLTMNGRSQTGIVACCSIDDYRNGVIRRHENTREEKELDRIRHVDITGAHTGPIFLAYRSDGALSRLTETVSGGEPLYRFVSEDGVGHTVWKADGRGMTAAIREAFEALPCTYIADGHHRAASAVKVGLKRRAENPGYTGEEPFNYFLSVLFPEDQLRILPYNRVVRDLNGLDKEAFLGEVGKNFDVEPPGGRACAPEKKGVFGMFLDGGWYRLAAKPRVRSETAGDPVRSLDVSLLQEYLLGPVLGIGDPRTDGRIDFVGGIRGTGELERRVLGGMAAAFSMYPTSIGELFAVADAGLLMPPKSTWFEPKLRSGLFIHRI